MVVLEWIDKYLKRDGQCVGAFTVQRPASAKQPCWTLARLAWVFLVQCGEASFPQIRGRGARFRKVPTKYECNGGCRGEGAAHEMAEAM